MQQARDDTMICPHCGSEAWVGSSLCPYCNQLLRPGVFDVSRYARPLWQVGLFTLLSLGLYLYPWAARTARFIDAARGGTASRSHGVLRALTLLIPIYWFRAIYRLAADVRDVNNDPDDDLDPARITWYSFGVFLCGRILPGGWALLAVVALLAVLLSVQQRVNDYCERVERGVTATRRLSRLDYAGVIAGAILTGSLVHFI